MSRDRYLPALRFRALTRFFDPLIGLGLPERRFKRRLLEQASPEPGQHTLDIGCGTGTLAVMAKAARPDVEVVGLDADHEILDLARSKARAAGVEVRFDHGLSTQLPYKDDSFDRVVSTLFFHHLTGPDKRLTAAEIARVLRPGGELHVGDWGRPADPLMWALFTGAVRVFDGFERTRDNAAGALPRIFERAGISEARETERMRTAFGTLCLYRARIADAREQRARDAFVAESRR
jgi:ubiquinone/menaquinone biosynthesis C-methylase UbiE